MSRLLVISTDRISEWIAKGEIIDRYYNPADWFDEVDILLTNDDVPDRAVLQRLVGRARFEFFNLPSNRLLRRTLGWQPFLVRAWALRAAEMVRSRPPDLVRCYGAHLNGMCAIQIRRAFGTPFVCSLHTLPGDPALPSTRGLRSRTEAAASARLQRTVLREADLVLAVYESLLPYLRAIRVQRFELAYNPLNGDSLRPKQDYAIARPVRVLSVGRLIRGKDPTNIVRAVARRADTHLTVVGDGPLASDLLQTIADTEVGDRVTWWRKLQNDELVAAMASHDIFAIRNDYHGIPKTVLEAFLVGMPVIINRTAAGRVPELTEDRCLLVEGSPEGFARALDQLIRDGQGRERLGRAARAWAEGALLPERAERRVVELYESVLSSRRR